MASYTTHRPGDITPLTEEFREELRIQGKTIDEQRRIAGYRFDCFEKARSLPGVTADNIFEVSEQIFAYLYQEVKPE